MRGWQNPQKANVVQIDSKGGEREQISMNSRQLQDVIRIIGNQWEQKSKSTDYDSKEGKQAKDIKWMEDEELKWPQKGQQMWNNAPHWEQKGMGMQYRKMYDRSQGGKQRWSGKSSKQQDQEKKGPANTGHPGSQQEEMEHYEQKSKGKRNKAMDRAAQEQARSSWETTEYDQLISVALWKGDPSRMDVFPPLHQALQNPQPKYKNKGSGKSYEQTMQRREGTMEETMMDSPATNIRSYLEVAESAPTTAKTKGKMQGRQVDLRRIINPAWQPVLAPRQTKGEWRGNRGWGESNLFMSENQEWDQGPKSKGRDRRDNNKNKGGK